MLIIREKQFINLQQNRDESLARRISRKLQELYPAECAEIGDDKLHESSLRCVDDSRTFGLQIDRSVMRLANLRFAIGQKFPDPLVEPEMAEILGDRTQSEAKRLDDLWEKVKKRESRLFDFNLSG